jgi:integrase/recombinase XerC
VWQEGADSLRKSWLQSLAHERRASPHTLRAYGDDVARFIGFQAGISAAR